MSKIIKISAIALSLSLLGGCASTDQLKAIEATAKEALSKANAAHSLATKANSTASDAAKAASEAQKTADSALECCKANSEKLDRMFEKAMAK
ncbi:MAG: Lpp/OprI family alanine-zipper lipoprotein [Gammaproteobacteria bacterium]|jgi:murein lipoprotein